MLYDFIFLLILFALIYSYTSSQNQFAATASAIRQIWSGSCRLSCRHSGHSGVSGLSGLPGPPHALGQYSAMKPGPVLQDSQVQQGQVARGNVAGPSHDCNCESCPCALIENFLRNCRPASNMYAELIQCTSNCVTYLLQMVEDAYEYVLRVFECNATCQQQAQLVSTREYTSSDENFNFGKGDKEKKTVEKAKSSIREKSSTSGNGEQQPRPVEGDSVPLTKKEGASKKDSKILDGDVIPMKRIESKVQQGTSKDLKDDSNIGKLDGKKVPDSSDESMVEKGYCSKCIEKGRTCIKECPRADKKAQKKK